MEFYKEEDFKQAPFAKIPNDWGLLKLEDIAEDIHYGITAKAVEEQTQLRMLRTTDIKNYQADWNKLPFCVITEKRKDIRRYLLKKGDLVIARAGTTGVSVLVDRDLGNVIFGSYLIKVRLNRRVHPSFIHYFCQSRFYWRHIISSQAGSTLKNINLPTLKSLKIPIPKLEEQRGIVEVLSVVDLAIQKTDEIIAKTERLKRGLMQTLLTKGIGHKKFKETPIGKIPKTWQVMRLKEVATVQRGKFAHRPRNDPRFYGGKIPFIQTGDIARASGIIKEYSQTLNEEGLKISKLFKKGTIVISIAGNIGDVGILGFDACFPDSVVGISVGNKINKLFLMYLLQYFKHELSGKAPRSTQKNINLQILESLKIPVPPLSEQEKIAKILFTIDKKLQIENENKKKLENIKRGLMDLLLTGKIRVRVN